MCPVVLADDRAVMDFHWQIPADFNIAVDVCDRWADQEPDRLGLIQEELDGDVTRVSFGALRARSNQAAKGIARATGSAMCSCRPRP